VLADNADVGDVAVVAVALSDIGIDGDEFGVGGIAGVIEATVVVVVTIALWTTVLMWLLGIRAPRTCTWWSDSSSNPVENVNFNECWGRANRLTYQTVLFELTGIKS
jgi:hypothetical protein